MTAILGISAFYHDSAAALLVDGKIVAAAQEERFTRKKHDAGFPTHAIAYCLEHAGLSAADLDYVGFYDKPLLKFERLLETYLSFAPAGFGSFLNALPVWLNKKLYLPREMSRGLGHAYNRRYVFTEHHESHAASAFYPSPFEEAAVLTVDGVGEWATASYGIGRGNRLTVSHEQRFPHSLGLLYSAFTYHTGFAVNSGEYKLMGLAPFGEPKYVDLILEKLVDLKPDGSLRLDLSYFDYCVGSTMTSKKFDQLFGGPPRRPDSPITTRDMDLAASIQKVTEETVLRMARHVFAESGLKNLCMAGGVALNCVANGRILREGPFDNLWFQPAAGDAGGALGVALFLWHQLLGNPRVPDPADSMAGAWLGPEFSEETIKRTLDNAGATYSRIDDDDALCGRVAEELAGGKVVGWFQGRMEFGPRALGARSLLGDPRDSQMQTTMNVKVKFREGFRPFAPAVLRERAAEYFDVTPGADLPYMLVVAPVATRQRLELSEEDRNATGIDKLKIERSTIPAVTHVDGSARVQTVDPERHALYRRVIEAFDAKTGCPVVVNTSFNLGWEPIVRTPEDAYETFMKSGIDALCMGHFLLTKADQPASIEWDEGAAGIVFPSSDREPESLRSMIDRARRDPRENAIDASIAYNTCVLVVGCDDSGLRANYLGVACRRVVGIDPSRPENLSKAEASRQHHGLDRVRYLTTGHDLNGLRAASFDVILRDLRSCSATNADVFDKNLSALLRPGGHLVLERPRGRVPAWFASEGVSLVALHPPGGPLPEKANLFKPTLKHSAIDRLRATLTSLVTREAARSWMVIGKKG